MRWIIAALGLYGVGCLVYGGVKQVTKQLRQGFTWRVPVTFLAGVVALYAVIGFFAALLVAMGAFDWVGSFEWPVGYARQTFQMSDGRVVVLHETANRVQVYDSHLHFLHGWPEGGMKWLVPTADGGVEIHARYRDSLRENVYTPDHQLRLQYDWPPSVTRTPIPDSTGSGRYIPTRWWLWPYTNPGYACLFCIPSIMLFALADPKGFRESWATSRST